VTTDIWMECPLGETTIAGFKQHYRRDPDYTFPCSGIHPGVKHGVYLGDWLKWLTERELDRIDKEWIEYDESLRE